MSAPGERPEPVQLERAFRLLNKALEAFYEKKYEAAVGLCGEALEHAATTWTGEWWEVGGGGTVWDSIAFDPEDADHFVTASRDRTLKLWEVESGRCLRTFKGPRILFSR